MDKERNEKVLSSWLKMTRVINNDRITAELPFNETLICRYLYQHRKEKVIASDLCAWTHMQKSQMNRTLTNMEKKKLIHRTRNEEDRREVFIELNEDMSAVYSDQHQEILTLVNEICSELGKEKTDEIVKMFDLVSSVSEKIIENKK